MKQLYIFFGAIIITASLFAQSPQKMSYQAVIRNSSKQLVTDTDIGMKISFFQGSENGTEVYSEIQTPTTNANGLVSVEIGNGTVILGDFATINWENGPYFIQVETDPSGGTSYTINGTSQFLSVPYAFHSNTFTGEMQNRNIINLADPVNDQDAATKVYVDALEKQLAAIEDKIKHLELVTGINPVVDIDGNAYKVVKIGNQIWMAENLKTTKYNDGTPIPNVTEKSEWINLSTASYCWYNNDISYKDTYGAIYNGYVIETDKICPEGWHVPSDEEWSVLASYLGGISVAAGKLKEIGTTHWQSPNTGATNETGFSALPSGNRRPDGSFLDLGYRANYHSSTKSKEGSSWEWEVLYDKSSLYRSSVYHVVGFSVRCLKN